MTDAPDRTTADAAERRAAAMEAIRAAQRNAADLDADLRRHQQHPPGSSAPGSRRAGPATGRPAQPRPHSSARPARSDAGRSDEDREAPAAATMPRATPAERLADVQATRAAFDAYHRSTRASSRGGRDRGPLARFIRRYGWRAYALPILVIITIVALASTDQIAQKVSSSPGASQAPAAASGPAQAAPSAQLKVDTPGTGSSDQPLISDVLPAGGPYTLTGNGTFSVIPGTTGVIGTGHLFKYTIDVEGGVTGVDLNAFASTVDSTLADPRSWVGANNVSLERVSSSAAADFHVTLTSSMTVRKFCGYDIPVETSCYDPNSHRVIENVARWVRGDLAYLGDLATYHLYMVNHEVGHALGHRHSHVCLSDGLAPAMMQQTLGLKSISGQICQSNPWPFPPGATDAPGVESADTAANSPIQIPNS